MIGSLIVGAIGVILLQNGNLLRKTGKKCEAIIYKNVFDWDKDGGCYYPVIRFLTDKQEWITQQLNVGFRPAKQEGTKLRVVYDPEEPTNVQIDSTFILIILPRVLLVVGVCGFIFGILEVFDVISILD